jgi:putative ABC transport system permease protein
MIELLVQLRRALRNLRRAPVFASGTILLLALGVGASAAVFTFVRGILLQPLRFAESDRLLILCETNESVAGHCVASPPNAFDWSTRARTLTAVGQGREWSFLLRHANNARTVEAGLASPQLFSVLQARPLYGRLLANHETHWDRARVAVLSHALWSGFFGADRAILGRSVELDRQNFTVVGVLPADFAVPEHENVELWVPFHFDPRAEDRRSWRGFLTLARLVPGATVTQANAELASIQQQLARAHPRDNDGWGVRAQSLKSHLVRSARPRLIAFGAAAGLLLLITCVNAAALFLVRVSARQHEFALRLALGANARILMRQVMAEGITMGAAAGLLAAGLAWGAVRLFVWLAPPGIPRLDEVHVDVVSLLFALALALLSATIVSILPVWRATRGPGYTRLREGAAQLTARSGLQLRRMLVVVEIAVALTLLVGSTLLMRSFASMLDWQPGFPRDGLLRVSFFAPVEKYGGAARLASLYPALERELAGLPGVASVGTASAGPLFGGHEASRFRIEGRMQQTVSDAVTLRWFDASPGFLSTLGLPLLRGRMLAESDRVGQPLVAVLNQTAARRYFATENPIGQRVYQLDAEMSFRIVGVVGDVQPLQRANPVEAQIYFSNRQLPRPFSYFLVRTSADPSTRLRSVEQRLQRIDPEFTIGSARTLDALLDRQLIAPRFQMLLLAAFAIVALALAGAGVFGVLAYAVALRAAEFGIRVALGARPVQLLRRVLSEALALAGAGLLLGAAGAILLGRNLTALLPGTPPTDALSYIVAVALMVTICLVASTVPAWRAMRVQPFAILRSQ